jgi:anti-sigma-K factor RskA
MSEPWEKSAHSGALWQQWKMIETRSNEILEGQSDMPDELTLAAYAEGRLAAPERAAIDALLSGRPDLAEDIALARRFVDDADDASAAELAPELAAVIARASALVPASGDRVIAFRPRRSAAPVWHSVARWSALAASFALASYLGFALGTDASSNLASLAPSAGVGFADEMFDPPTGFLGPTGDASST